MTTPPAPILPNEILLTAEGAQEAAKVTYRQLDHWCRSGILKPFRDAQGSGRTRRFVYNDVVVAACLGVWQQHFRSTNIPRDFQDRVLFAIKTGGVASWLGDYVQATVDVAKVQQAVKDRMCQVR